MAGRPKKNDRIAAIIETLHAICNELDQFGIPIASAYLAQAVDELKRPRDDIEETPPVVG